VIANAKTRSKEELERRDLVPVAARLLALEHAPT
jgi:hypothetical protein